MDIPGEYEVVAAEGQSVSRKEARDKLPTVNNHSLKKLNHKHMYIMDCLLYSPDMNMTQIAKKLNTRVSWVSLVVGCDLFQEELRKRRTELDSFKRDKLASRMLDVGDKALDRLETILDDEESSDSVATTAAKNVLTGLGFMNTNGNNSPGVNIQVNADNAQVSALGVTREMLDKVKNRRD